MTPGRIQKKFLSRGLGSQLELVATGQTWDTVTISKKINLKCLHHIYTEKRKKAKQTRNKTSVVTIRECHQGTHCFEKTGKISSVYPFLPKPQGKQVIDIKLVFM